MSLRLLLVDDHAMFREALRSLLEKEPGIEVVGETGDGAAVVEVCERLKPDVVVMDVSLPNVNGIEATRNLLAVHPEIRVVALSAYGYRHFVMQMLEAGAVGYVVKAAAGEQLVMAVHSAAMGRTYLCPDCTATLVEANLRAKPPTSAPGVQRKRLGARETEVLRLLSQGLSSPEIGRSLHIATSTVEVHRRNIMDKLDLHSVAALTKHAIRLGITEI